jgi:uncharacterized protein with ParB-like and HNH nuclease domain
VFSKTKVKSQMQKRLKCITVLPSGINEFEENFIKGGVQILIQYKQNLIAEHDAIKSTYENLMSDHTPFLRKYLCKVKIPLKIKIFMWFLSNKVLLTR